MGDMSLIMGSDRKVIGLGIVMPRKGRIVGLSLIRFCHSASLVPLPARLVASLSCCWVVSAPLPAWSRLFRRLRQAK